MTSGKGGSLDFLVDMFANVGKKIIEGRKKAFERAWYNQPGFIRGERRKYIIKMVRLFDEHLEKYGPFGTAAYNIAIDAIIEGDPDKCTEAVDFALMAGLEPDLQEQAKVQFAPMIELCAEAKVVIEGEARLLANLLEGKKGDG